MHIDSPTKYLWLLAAGLLGLELACGIEWARSKRA